MENNNTNFNGNNVAVKNPNKKRVLIKNSLLIAVGAFAALAVLGAIGSVSSFANASELKKENAELTEKISTFAESGKLSKKQKKMFDELFSPAKEEESSK